MRIKNCLIKFCLLAITVLSANITSAQVPSRENFTFIFENNYDDDHAGDYMPSDFITDWNKEAGSRPEGNLEIISDDANHQKIMRAYYPSGTLSPSQTHGFTWYSYLPVKGEEIYFSYDIRFKPGFQWVHGGKIPGLMGGSVTSGQDPSLNNGFNVRMMWKGGGSLVFYVYHHDQTNIYGDTYFLEGFRFETGRWYNLTIRLVLNSLENGTGISNGILEGYVDGKLYFQKTNFRFRMNDKIKIERMYICSFFGGNTQDWAAARDEWIDTDNYVCYSYTAKAANVPIGYQKNTTGLLLHPYYSREGNVDTPKPEVPQGPTQLKSTNQTSSTIQLSWTDNSGTEDGFVLDRSLSSNEGFAQVAACGPNEVSCTDNSLEPGVRYYYRLRAFNTTGYSDFSNVIEATTKPVVPVAASTDKTIFIDPDNANDEYADGSIYHPFNSWSKISWKTGNTYLQKRGTIVTIDALQIGASHVKIGSYGEGRLPVIKSQTNTYLISGFEKSYITISDLNLQANNAISCIYFVGKSTDSITIERCNLSGNINAIKIIDGNTFNAMYNFISSQQDGIFSTAASNSIFYNVFTSCNTSVNLISSVSKAYIFNNVFYDNIKSVSSSIADITLFNNIFYMTGKGQKALGLDKGRITSDCNIFYPEYDGFISVAGKNYKNLIELQKSLNIDLKSISSDPSFVDIEYRNFKLRSTSPAINSGKNITSISHDMDGIKVPLFEKTDIGAYEFDGDILKSINKNEAEISMKLFPNPSTGPLSIEVKIPSERSVEIEPIVKVRELKIIDITGKLMFSRKMNSETTIIEDQFDLSSYKNGLYFVIMQVGNSIIKEKLMISK